MSVTHNVLSVNFDENATYPTVDFPQILPLNLVRVLDPSETVRQFRIANDGSAVLLNIGAVAGPSPEDFGGVGDGVANDTAALTSFEASIYGQDVDLRGLTYLVDDFPLLNQYYNGSFRTATETRRLPRNPLSHPLDGEAHVINDNGRSLHYSGPTCDLPTGLLVAHTKAWRHGQSDGSPLVVEMSLDQGMTLERPITMPMNSDQRAGFVYGGPTASGDRFVFSYALTDTGGTRDNVLAYTDGNEVFNFQTFAGTNIAWSSDPVIDDQGFMVFVGYGPGGIHYLRTLDGTPANTSAPAVLKATASTGVTLTETVLVKLGQARYMMLSRNNSGGTQAKAWVSFGTSLSSPDFTDFVESNIDLGGNPPSMIVKWGRLYHYALARLASPIEGEKDRLMVASINVDDIWAQRENLPASSVSFTNVLPGRAQFIGALQMSEDRQGNTIGHVTDGETTVGGSNPQAARCVIVGPTKRISPIRPQGVSLIRNGDLRLWTRGTSFDLADNINNTPGPDGMELYANGAATASRVELPDYIRQLLPNGARYGLRFLSTDAGGFFRQCVWNMRGEDYRKAVGRVCNFQGWFYGETPGTDTGNGQLRVRIRLNPDSADPVIETVTHFAQKRLSAGLTELRATVFMPSDTGVTLGPNPTIQIVVMANNAGTCDFTYCGGHWTTGAEPPHQVNYQNENNSQYVNLLDFDLNQNIGQFDRISGTNLEGVIRFPTMIKPPTISLFNCVPADFSLNDSNETATAVTFNYVTKNQAEVLWTFSAVTSRTRVWSRKAEIGFLLDAES